MPGAPDCPLFPKTSHWNLRVDRLPVLERSDRMVRAIGSDSTMHADFGSGLYEGAKIGIPFVTVGRSQRKVPVSFDYADESDRGPYPIPRGAPIEGGRGSDGDRHVIVVDRGRCRLYELYARLPARTTEADGERDQARYWTCVRTGCGRAGGPRPTPRGSRSSRGWRATTR